MIKDIFSQPLTYEKLDSVSEAFKKAGLSVHGWYPSLEEIEKFVKPNLPNNIDFIFFILETAGSPQNDEQRHSRQILLNLFNDNAVIVAEVDDLEDEKFDTLCKKLKKRFPDLPIMWENVTKRSLSKTEKERLQLYDISQNILRYKDFLNKRGTYKKIDKSVIAEISSKLDIY